MLFRSCDSRIALQLHVRIIHCVGIVCAVSVHVLVEMFAYVLNKMFKATEFSTEGCLMNASSIFST